MSSTLTNVYQNKRSITPLESALTNLTSRKSFIARTYVKMHFFNLRHIVNLDRLHTIIKLVFNKLWGRKPVTTRA